MNGGLLKLVQGEIQLVKPVDLPGGKMVIALFKDTPKTSENFLQLCQVSVVKLKLFVIFCQLQLDRLVNFYCLRAVWSTRKAKLDFTTKIRSFSAAYRITWYSVLLDDFTNLLRSWWLTQ